MEHAGYELIDASGVVRKGQGYGSRSVYRYTQTGQAVEVDLYRDAYDKQSRFRVAVWTDNGWVRVASRDGEALTDLPSYVERSDAACGKALADVEADLLRLAAAILEPVRS